MRFFRNGVARGDPSRFGKIRVHSVVSLKSRNRRVADVEQPNAAVGQTLGRHKLLKKIGEGRSS